MSRVRSSLGQSNAHMSLFHTYSSKAYGSWPTTSGIITWMMDIELPAVADPVGEALHFLRMSGTFYCRSEFTSPWALSIPAMQNCLMLHVVTAGRCILQVDETAQQTLHPGDLTLVPHGEGHVLTSSSGLTAAKLFEIEREQVSERYETLRLGGGGDRTTMICALFQFEDPAAQQLIIFLPKVINVDSWATPQSDWIQSTLRMMAAEASEMRPGGETVITRLADILVIQAIRYWITHAPSEQTGWLGALHDPQIGPIISKIHRRPGRSWTLESLAAEAFMSRSAFSARFTELVGESAMRYVTRWRMNDARSRLQRGERIAEIAISLGYESEAAFSRAFKRHLGLPPGAVRRARSDSSTLST
ncbi:MAG TPA: AraC family transcriptional regulator [Terriglobales bacterium]|nr:AraC family transcriptional regulator [Terriglobales bacterium]